MINKKQCLVLLGILGQVQQENLNRQESRKQIHTIYLEGRKCLYILFLCCLITRKSTFRSNKTFDELLEYSVLSQLKTLYTLFLHLCELLFYPF